MARPIAGRRSATAALPEWIQPQLTELVDEAPEGSGWLHEIKFDGYRMHARLNRGAVRLLTRTGLDWTQATPAREGPGVRIPLAPAGRWYGAGGEEMAPSSLHLTDGVP
jgi:ATP-dependent DNA ligase